MLRIRMSQDVLPLGRVAHSLGDRIEGSVLRAGNAPAEDPSLFSVEGMRPSAGKKHALSGRHHEDLTIDVHPHLTRKDVEKLVVREVDVPAPV
jgi:hypothetical protein